MTPSIPKDNSAEIARQEEAKRQANIKTGQSNIDSAFQQFTPDYYNNYTNAYEGAYNPQVDEQYSRAKQDEKYNLARAGTLDSTPGQTAFDRLTEAYGQQRQGVASNALNSTNTLRTNVANEKSNLYALNESAADPSLAATQAVAQAGALQTAPSYSPLGDLFGGLVDSTATYLAARNNSSNPYIGSYSGYGMPNQFQPGSGGLPSSSGSGRVVG